MNENDAMEVLNGVVANALSAQAIFFTALSAYLAVAYTAGNKLSKYQVAFVNIIFVVIFLNMSGNQLGLLQAANYYIQIVEQARAAAVDPIDGVPEKLNMVVFFGIRFLLLVGSFLFMWSVRHPKAE